MTAPDLTSDSDYSPNTAESPISQPKTPRPRLNALNARARPNVADVRKPRRHSNRDQPYSALSFETRPTFLTFFV